MFLSFKLYVSITVTRTNAFIFILMQLFYYRQHILLIIS